MRSGSMHMAWCPLWLGALPCCTLKCELRKPKAMCCPRYS